MEPADSARQLGGGDIFKFDTKYIVDSQDFWILLVIMIVFMIVVDRLQYLSEIWVGQTYSRRVFMDRVNAEMLMFGIVAITIFLFQYAILSLDPHMNDVLHFVDLLCSCGACSLIFFGGMLMGIQSLLPKWYTGISKDKHGNWGHTDGAVDDRLEYYIMAGAFMAKTNVVPGFRFGHYLTESFGLAIGMLITLDWVPWVILLVPCCIALILVNVLEPKKIAFQNKMLGFVIFNMGMLVTIAAFGVWVRTKRYFLSKHMGVNDESVKAKVRELVEATMKEDTAGKLPVVTGVFAQKLQTLTRKYLDVLPPAPGTIPVEITHRVLQFFALCTTMSMSLYLCHLLYNIETHMSEAPEIWHAVNVSSLLLCFGLLPWILNHITVIMAVVAPDAELIDRVVHDEREFEQDCEDIKKQLKNMTLLGFLTPVMINSLEEKVMKDEMIGHDKSLQKFLSWLHVHMSRERLSKLRQHMHGDNSGTLSYAEFFNFVNGDPPNMLEKKGAVTLLEDLKGGCQEDVEGVSEGRTVTSLYVGGCEDDAGNMPSILPVLTGLFERPEGEGNMPSILPVLSGLFERPEKVRSI